MKVTKNSLRLVFFVTLLLILGLWQKKPILDTVSEKPLARKILGRVLLDRESEQPPSVKTLQAAAEPDVLEAESAAFKAYPHLAASYKLTHKVLKTDEEWEELRALHTDRAAIEASANYLIQDAALQEDLSLAHFRHIDFLKKSLSLQDNPAEDMVIEKVASVLQYEPKDWKNLSEKSRQVWLGDKIDLIYAMQAFAPGSLEKIIQQDEGKRLARLVQYANDNRKFLQMVEL